MLNFRKKTYQTWVRYIYIYWETNQAGQTILLLTNQKQSAYKCLALRASACAKPLLCWCVWEKEKNCSELTEDMMSLIKWPTKGRWKVETLRACLDIMKTKWYHSVFMIHHPNWVGLTDDKLFGLILDDYFHDSKTQNFGCGWWKMRIGFWCFLKLKTETQWQMW